MKKENKLFPSMDTKRVKIATSFSWAFTGTLLIASSVVQASDMQIYAVPTAGKKTIVMMLDTSGSMGVSSINADYGVCSDSTTVSTDTGGSGTSTYTRTFCSVSYSTSSTSNYQRLKDACSNPNKNADGTLSTRTAALKCYDRLSRLKDGMFNFLGSSDSVLTNVRVGLGHYSVAGSGNAGRILVPAETLDVVDSVQRNAIKTAVKNLTATGGTPTAAAYAEAAAYLMGTTTIADVEIAVDVYLKQIVRYECRNSSYPFFQESTNRCWDDSRMRNRDNYIAATAVVPARENYYRCDSLNATDFTNETQTCRSGGWTFIGNSAPANLAQDGNYGDSTNTVYYKNQMQNGANPYSGFGNSVASSKKADGLSYASPLPADRVSCDGQGVYILSDGVPTDKTDATLNSTMNATLNSTSFACNAAGALSSAGDWHCMSNYAKKLFNGGIIQPNAANATNPVNAPIQTAFVGFGSDFSDISTSSDVTNACKLTSRTQADRTGNDACSPNQGTNAVANPGFGNGGFFTAQNAEGVTKSVIAFIDNIGAAPLEPLTTGAISVPLDPLTSNGFQPYGYLRALEPNPANAKLVWLGNLKKYQVLLSGTNAGTFGDKNGNLIYGAKGAFVESTKDMWSDSSYNDGGIIKLGGAYSKVPMPALGQAEDLTQNPKQYAFASTPDALRNLFTDVASTGGATLAAMSNDNTLLRIPEGPVPATGVSSYLLGKLQPSTGQATLKDFPLLVKQKIINYLGYSLPLDATATALPTSLTTPAEPSFAMGASVHSFPVQLTYSGTLDSKGDLTATRSQSVLYGSMEGGLHVVNGNTGVEQMVFVPSEILRDPVASKALVKGEQDINSPTAGIDGAWVADPAYKVSADGASIAARQMNVYGGMRMGGTSYYGLDLLTPSSPKLLFRAGADQIDFARMGQSWSKPVLANIRYGDVIKRVMIVGGGYDTCYESPTFALAALGSGTTCADTSAAKGNAVYIIDAKTGARLWWASNSGSNSNNADMKHSIVSRISALDRNADGLVDHLYFGDLGGQVFRADLNNAVGTTAANFGKRVVRLANLATTETGTAVAAGKNPRFYEAPTVSIHDQGSNTFILVGMASGNRSTPLDVFPIQGRNGMSPAVALNDRLVNNVYGIIDRDFINKNLMTIADTALITKDKTLLTFKKNPQLLTSGTVVNTFFPALATATGMDGWYRSLSSKSDGTERADNSFRIPGGLKAFEEPIALTGNLIVPVYDPQGTGITPSSSCLPRVVGETNRQLYCLPFGVCLNSDGTNNSTLELKTGFRTSSEATKCPVGVAECNDITIGSGIRGVALVPKSPDSDPNSCGVSTLAGNDKGVGEWKCTRKLDPTRWYERYISN